MGEVFEGLLRFWFFIKSEGGFLKYLDLLSWGGRRKKMIKIKKSVREKSPDLNLD